MTGYEKCTASLNSPFDIIETSIYQKNSFNQNAALTHHNGVVGMSCKTLKL